MSRSTLMTDGNGIPVQIMRPDPDSTQKIAYTSGAGVSTLFNTPVGVRLYCTSDCHVEFGPNASSLVDTGSMFLPAGSVEYFYANKGDYIAVVQDTAAGYLYITEMA